jgi:uncharacterized protein (DUF736 family)
MLNAVGYVTERTDGRYVTFRTVGIKADLYILPNTHKTTCSQPDFRVMAEADEIGVGQMCKGAASKQEYVNISITAPEPGLKKLYANLSKAAGSDDNNLCTEM